MTGSTTVNIAEAGNIREDMFRLLVTIDLVIADLSIHNANVFYELGIRHALRPHGALLIRADVHSYPFDLQTDRFLLYDRQAPARASRNSPRRSGDCCRVRHRQPRVQDAAEPSRSESNRAASCAAGLPRGGRLRASRTEERGDLRLLAHEAGSFEWASEGLRTVGRAQFGLGAWSGAQETFESFDADSSRLETNQRLGTIYQKAGGFRPLESGDSARHRF